MLAYRVSHIWCTSVIYNIHVICGAELVLKYRMILSAKHHKEMHFMKRQKVDIFDRDNFSFDMIFR
jgi:hypothetical protein